MKTVLIFILLLPFAGAKADSAGYEVPGVPAEDSTYQIHDLEFKTRDKEIHLTYTLPQALTGVKNDIQAVGTVAADGKTLLMNSNNGKFSCDLASRKCDVKYNSLKFDFGEIEKTLRASGLSENKIQDRLFVSRSFSGDPIGVIHF